MEFGLGFDMPGASAPEGLLLAVIVWQLSPIYRTVDRARCSAGLDRLYLI